MIKITRDGVTIETDSARDALELMKAFSAGNDKLVKVRPYSKSNGTVVSGFVRPKGDRRKLHTSPRWTEEEINIVYNNKELSNKAITRIPELSSRHATKGIRAMVANVRYGHTKNVSKDVATWITNLHKVQTTSMPDSVTHTTASRFGL